MLRSSNPVLSEGRFEKASHAVVRHDDEAMAMDGCVNKTLLLFVLLLIPAAFVWYKFGGELTAPQVSTLQTIMWGGAIAGLVLGLVTSFKVEWAPVTAPTYAFCKGLALGAISTVFEMRYPGIVIQAVGLTFATFGGLLFAYRAGLIKATRTFRKVIVGATMAIGLVYLVTFVLSFFGASIPFIHESGPIGIGFSLIVVTVAALNLVLDFDFIERGVAAGAPKHMEWYAAFGLTVTLIWLYIEFLRLLSKLASSRR